MIDWIESLKESNKLKIVEGKKDLKALYDLDIRNIREINKPLYSFVEEISETNQDVIILTDLDKHGRKLYSYLKHNLQKRKVRIDNYFREYLFKNTTLTQIEGIKNYTNREH